MKRIYEFQCDEGHYHEAYVDSELRSNPCPECGKPATRLISTPMVKLDGTSGAFPGEAMKWERKRAEKLAQEQRRSASHGE
jgi:hypothetical protein